MFFTDQKSLVKEKTIKLVASCSLLLFMATPVMASQIIGRQCAKRQGASIASPPGTCGNMVLLTKGGNGNGGGGNGNGGSGDNGGHGPGDGTGNGGDGPADGTGHGPGTGDCPYLG